MFNNNLIVCNN